MWQRALKMIATASTSTGTTGQIAAGTFTPSSSGTKSINCGFRPKYIAVIQAGGTGTAVTQKSVTIYDARFDSSSAFTALNNTNGTKYSLPNTANYKLNSVTSTGFVMATASSAFKNGWYFACTDV